MPRPRPPAPVDPRILQRERVEEVKAKYGIPDPLAIAVVQGKLSVNDALERLARRSDIERLMRKHDLTRAIATQIALGQANLDAYLARRRMDNHVQANRHRSCLDEALTSGTTLSYSLHGQRRIEGKLIANEAYEVVIQPATGPEERVHKLQIKAAWLPDDWKKIRKAMRKDKTLGDAPLAPIERPQDRYGLSDRRLFGYHDRQVPVDVTLLEGEIIRGAVAWFSRYEVALSIKEARVVIFRHAIHDMREAS